MIYFIMPHAPFLIPEIGQGEQGAADATIKSMEKIAEEIKQAAPKTIALISPHGNVFSDGLCINTESELTGSFEHFHQPKLRLTVKGDFQKALIFCSALRAAGINNLALDEITAKKYDISTEIDYGALVPLHYILQKHTNFKLIHINIGYLPNTQMYQAGKILAEIMGEDGVIIASGDLSHALEESSPEKYDEMGAVYDKYIANSLKSNDVIKIMTAEGEMTERAAQCVQKPLEMLAGALDGYTAKCSVYSYEAPYGVGYLTAKIQRENTDKENLINQYLQIKKESDLKKEKAEDEYASLAADTIRNYVINKSVMDIPQGLGEELYIKQNGVFVSLKKDGRLRGCVGTVTPTKLSTAEEIMGNAIEAATKDSRFDAVQENELASLEIYVDVLSELEEVNSKEDLDIKKYGIVVTKNDKRGLMFPNIDGVKDVSHQIEAALEKAKISKDEDYLIQRFTVTRHKR